MHRMRLATSISRQPLGLCPRVCSPFTALYRAFASGRMPKMNACKNVVAVLDTFDGFGHKMQPQDLAATWNRIGKLAGMDHRDRLWLQRNPEALSPLLERTQGVMGRFPAIPLANTTHAMAKIGSKTGWRPERGVWEALAVAAVLRVRRFGPQALSNTVWAFATANHEAPALFDAVAKAAVPRLGEFKPQELSNTAWAYATANHEAPALFDAVAEAAVPQLGEFVPQELSNTAWAYATANHDAPALFDAVAKAAVP